MSTTINVPTQDEFASAVSSAIGSVHHLYREINRLLTGLNERIAEDPNPLDRVRVMIQPSQKDQGFLMIRNEYGALFKSAGADNEDAEEDEDSDEESDEPDDEDAPQKRRRSVPVELVAKQPLLAVRVAVYDPKKKESFEPQIQYAVMDQWTVGRGAYDSEERFLLQKKMLNRIPKPLGSNLSQPVGARISTRAKVKNTRRRGDDAYLACRLPAGVRTTPLYKLDTAGALDSLVQDMKMMWNEAIVEVVME